jgi:hypothetical protein
MVSLWNLYLTLKLWRNLRNQKFLKAFEVKTLLLIVEVEKAISVGRIEDHFLRRQTTELHDLEDLIIIVLTREDGCLNKKFNCSAAQ